MPPKIELIMTGKINKDSPINLLFIYFGDLYHAKYLHVGYFHFFNAKYYIFYYTKNCIDCEQQIFIDKNVDRLRRQHQITLVTESYKM